MFNFFLTFLVFSCFSLKTVQGNQDSLKAVEMSPQIKSDKKKDKKIIIIIKKVFKIILILLALAFFVLFIIFSIDYLKVCLFEKRIKSLFNKNLNENERKEIIKKIITSMPWWSHFKEIFETHNDYDFDVKNIEPKDLNDVMCCFKELNEISSFDYSLTKVEKQVYYFFSRLIAFKSMTETYHKITFWNSRITQEQFVEFLGTKAHFSISFLRKSDDQEFVNVDRQETKIICFFDSEITFFGKKVKNN